MNQAWIDKAEALKPTLIETIVPPVAIVEPVADEDPFRRWRMMPVDAELDGYLMRDGDSVTLDFGDHLTGHYSLSVRGEGRGVDSPVRLKLIFGEVAAEVVEPFDPYDGSLSRAWLQDEVINIDVLPAVVNLPRRYSFRYVRIEVVATSPCFGVRLSDPYAISLTSATGTPSPLPATASDKIRRIDEVSIRTLSECMQTVFEDGPKRDQRLWVGDLRLQALANYATFRNFDLVKRCLYLFAGFPREDGLVPACVFERPTAMRGHEYILDYAALFGPTLLEYGHASGDWETVTDLWSVVVRQMELLSKHVKDGLFEAPVGAWVFIDWCDGLDRTAAMHGVMVYALRQAHELALRLGETSDYALLIDQMTTAARGAFFDESAGVFTSGETRQVSWATQAWMVIAGIATKEEGMVALRKVLSNPDAIRPGAPYMYHYVVEALLLCDLKQEAQTLLESYWGGMVEHGADTFWEVYDPEKPMLSPYNNVLVNSYCHAWSCTPAYLIRTCGLGF